MAFNSMGSDPILGLGVQSCKRSANVQREMASRVAKR